MQSASDTPSSHLREPSRRADRRGVRRGGVRRANPGTIRLSPFPESLAAGSRQVSRGITRHSCAAFASEKRPRAKLIDADGGIADPVFIQGN